MGNLKNKKLRLETSTGLSDAVDGISKNAWADAYFALLARCNGHADKAPTIDEVALDLSPTLIARGDRLSHNHPVSNVDISSAGKCFECGSVRILHTATSADSEVGVCLSCLSEHYDNDGYRW